MKNLNLLILTLSLSLTSFSGAYAKDSISGIQPIKTEKAGQPLGSYSQGMAVDLSKGKLLFVAGQVANDPKTGKLLEDDIRTATQQTLDNIEAILKAAGTDWEYVARVDVFLKDFKDFGEMNKEYKKRFPNGVFPARQTVQVGMSNRVEISCIALIPNK